MIRAQAMAKRLEKENKVEGNAGNGRSNGGGDSFFKNGYITHDAVTAESMRVLTRNGLHFQPILKSHKQDGNRTVVEIDGVITNVDNPDEQLTFPGVGYGVDSSDKGPGKAMSYAKKMCLSQALMLNTHEDIEASDTPFEPANASAAAREAAAVTDTAIKAWADTYRAALSNCKSLPDLKRLRAENAHMMNHARVPEITKEFFIDMITQLEGALS